MTVLPVRTVPDPVLRTAASPVPAGADVRALVADMIETMHAVGGVGLAAPQVGVGLRVFVFDVAGVAGHVVNPVLETAGQALREPGELMLTDFSKIERPAQLHAGFQALDAFQVGPGACAGRLAAPEPAGCPRGSQEGRSGTFTRGGGRCCCQPLAGRCSPA